MQKRGLLEEKTEMREALMKERREKEEIERKYEEMVERREEGEGDTEAMKRREEEVREEMRAN